jgi:hypothetical protein
MAMWFARHAEFSKFPSELKNLRGGWAGGSAWPDIVAWPVAATTCIFTRLQTWVLNTRITNKIAMADN